MPASPNPKSSSLSNRKNKMQGSVVKPRTAGNFKRSKRDLPYSSGSDCSNERSPNPNIKGGTVTLQPHSKPKYEPSSKGGKEELETSGFQNKALVE